MKIKTVLLTGLATVALTAQPAFAQGYSPYGYGYNQYDYNAYNYNTPAYGYSDPYGYRNYNYATPYNYNQPYAYNQPYGYSAPYGYYPYKKKNKFFNKNKMPFSGNSDIGEEFWPGRDSIWEDAAPLDGPWNRGWGPAPWNRDYDDLWEPGGGPDKWFDFDDPKEGMAWAWEDMMITPNSLGRMPGGWESPTISVPNPIDVGDEFKNAAGDAPGEMKNFSEGFKFGEAEPYDDTGGFGFGQKKDGVKIEPKLRR
ncbi:MAG: hypothetical protein QNJ56_02785 [Gammaproteobacteria bacterium]|nr:hypothetical protein [Gammaproteobacteria bacterium]